MNRPLGAVLLALGIAGFAVSAATWASFTGFSALLCTVAVLVAYAGLVLVLPLEVGIAAKWQLFWGTLAYWMAVDQATKYGTTLLRVHADEIPVIPGWLSVVHAQNFGAAFSSLEGQFWVFIVFAGVATVIVGDLMRRMAPDQTFMAGILGMILSGAWGNGLDRLTKGHVTDFIRVYSDAPGIKAWLIQNFGTNTWPIFNVADSVLLVGVTVFLAHYLMLDEDEPADVDAALEDSEHPQR